jgi:hypothetical protein
LVSDRSGHVATGDERVSIEDYFGIVVVGVIVVGFGLPLLFGRARTERWGERETKHSTGDDPYRGGEVSERKPRSAPRWIRIVAGLNAAWGVLSALVFAPPVGLLALVLADSFGIGITLLALVALDGLVLPFVLGIAAKNLLSRRNLSWVKTAVRWSFAHHLTTIVAFMVTSATAEFYGESTLWLCAIGWCGTGALLAGLMQRAYVGAVRASAAIGDTTEVGAELPD